MGPLTFCLLCIRFLRCLLAVFKTQVLFVKPRHVNRTLRPPLSGAVSIGVERTRGRLAKHARLHVCVSIPDYVIGRECRPTTQRRGEAGPFEVSLGDTVTTHHNAMLDSTLLRQPGSLFSQRGCVSHVYG